MCTFAILESAFEEEEKLNKAVKFYPHFPEERSIAQEYNSKKLENNQLVLKSLERFETFCGE